MRISHISVSGLFGIFDHQIPLNLEERITIILGPNGYGKTVILRMIDGIFSSQYYKFRNIPFREFRIDFYDNQGSLILEELTNSQSRSKDLSSEGRELQLRFTRKGQRAKTHKILPKKPSDHLRYPLSMIEDDVPGLERTGSRTWRYYLTGETLTLEDIVERFPEQVHPSFFQPTNEPAWLTTLRESVHVHLIETQRLLGQPDPRQIAAPLHPRRTRDLSRSAMMPAVTVYSYELASAIRTKLAESAELSQNLDRSFPQRVVTQDGSSPLTVDQLRAELDQLESKRQYLVDTGLLDPGQEPEIGASSRIDDEMMRVLSVYVKDARQKLAVFDDIAARIDLLKKLTNGRFLYKDLTVSRDKGFVILNPVGEEVPVTGLSSGEQHRLVLLHELLFRVPEGALILIDEPELSLHVGWQESFLRDIQEIATIRNFDVLIATHSPQIISDRWDLTVELKGPSQV